MLKKVRSTDCFLVNRSCRADHPSYYYSSHEILYFSTGEAHLMNTYDIFACKPVALNIIITLVDFIKTLCLRAQDSI